MTVALGYVEDGEFLTVPCPAAGATKDDIVEIGGILGIAKNTTTSGLDLQVYVPKKGTVVRLTKVAGFVPALGELAFYDLGSDQRLEAFSSGTSIRPVGFYAASALTGDTAARVIWDPDRAEEALEIHRVPLKFKANDAQGVTFRARRAGKIIGIDYYTMGKPSSASGAVNLTSKNVGVSDNPLFSSLNLETITDNAMTEVTLTVTAADLVFAQGGLAEFIVTSDNADGNENDGTELYIYFQRT